MRRGVSSMEGADMDTEDRFSGPIIFDILVYEDGKLCDIKSSPPLTSIKEYSDWIKKLKSEGYIFPMEQERDE